MGVFVGAMLGTSEGRLLGLTVGTMVGVLEEVPFPAPRHSWIMAASSDIVLLSSLGSKLSSTHSASTNVLTKICLSRTFFSGPGAFVRTGNFLYQANRTRYAATMTLLVSF